MRPHLPRLRSVRPCDGAPPPSHTVQLRELSDYAVRQLHRAPLYSLKWGIALSMLVIVLFVALFGLTLLLSHSDHHAGCPLMALGSEMCESTIIEHVSLWHGMLVSIIAVTLALVACIAWYFAGPQLVVERVRYRRREWINRPTLLQELYSQGILNRKEFYRCAL